MLKWLIGLVSAIKNGMCNLFRLVNISLGPSARSEVPKFQFLRALIDNNYISFIFVGNTE